MARAFINNSDILTNYCAHLATSLLLIVRCMAQTEDSLDGRVSYINAYRNAKILYNSLGSGYNIMISFLKDVKYV